MKASSLPPPGGFEQRLLAELREFVDARADAQASSGVPSARTADRDRFNGGRPRSPLHRRRILSVSAAVTGAVTAAVVVALGATTSTPAAYAVAHNPNGTVTVTVRQLTGPAIAAINARLRQMGITERVIPVKAGCKTRKIILYGGPKLRVALAGLYTPEKPSKSLTFSPSSNKLVLPPYALVLAAGPLPHGKVGLKFVAVKSPVPSCYTPAQFQTQ